MIIGEDPLHPPLNESGAELLGNRRQGPMLGRLG